MAKPFHELRERLLHAGVAPRHVRRYLTELTDHLADLTAEEERAGRTLTDAESAASARLGRLDAVGDVRSRPALSTGCRLFSCLLIFVVWLEDLCAGSGYALRSPSKPNLWAWEYLFSGRQVLLYQRADSRRLGNWTRRRPAKIEGGLAHGRFGPDRMDGRHSRDSRESNRRTSRTRAYQHELLHSWTVWPSYFRAVAIRTCDFHLHRAAVSRLEITKGPFRLVVFCAVSPGQTSRMRVQLPRPSWGTA